MVLELATLIGLLNSCQSQVDPSVLKRIIDNESSRNPYSIGVVGKPSFPQPNSKDEALDAATKLISQGKDFSLGLMQIRYANLEKYGLTIEDAFDACSNINGGSKIFSKCFFDAKGLYPHSSNEQLLNYAASCYYSGNFSRGFKKEGEAKTSYVDRFNAKEPLNNSMISENSNNQTTKADAPSWDVFGDFNH